MQVLCDRCIKSLKSRGESVLVGYALDEDNTEICCFCEESEADLHMVMLNPFRAWGEW